MGGFQSSAMMCHYINIWIKFAKENFLDKQILFPKFLLH